MLPKKGTVLPYQAAIADALQRQLGTTHQAVKIIRRWTWAGERTVKNWLVGVSGPSGQHLVDLIRNSDEVLETLLLLADRPQNPRGQTLNEQHFLRSVAPMSASPEDLQQFSLDEIFFLHPDPDLAGTDAERKRWPERARKPWIGAYYNAWRDQYVQPPWWHIFQTILACIEAALWADIPGPFVFHSFARLLKIKFVKLRYQIFNAKMRNQLIQIGLVTAVILIAWRFGIFSGPLSFASDDVKKSVDNAILILILALGGLSIAALLSALSQSFVPDLDFTAEHKQIGVRDPIGRFRAAFTAILAAVDRPILLVIDDIDRCDPKTVVEVLRGFQTIIRSPRLFVLVLGDRTWIEKAHEIHHKDFTGITVGGENTLGERFVEKIFQLSFTLPAMTPEIRDRFTRTVLGASADLATPMRATGSSQAAEIPQNRREAFGEIERRIGVAKRADTVGARERLVDAVQRETEAFAAESGITKEEVTALGSKALVDAAASDARYQQQVANVLLGLAARLPSNPRQIKRIINAFAIHETVGRLYFNYRVTMGGNKDLSRRWRQLAMWTTLATEWPQTWRELAREPRCVDAAYSEEATAREKLHEELIEGKSEDAKKKMEQLLLRLTGDPALSRLLCIKGDSAAADNGGKAPAVANLFANVRIDADAIYEFNRIMWEPGFPTAPLQTLKTATSNGGSGAARGRRRKAAT